MHRDRSTSASQAPTRTSTATKASGMPAARSPRCRPGRRARAHGCRAQRRSRLRPRVGLANIERLDKRGLAERACALEEDQRVGEMPRIVVGRDARATRLEDLAIADGAVADQHPAGNVEVLRAAHLRPGREYLAAPC